MNKVINIILILNFSLLFFTPLNKYTLSIYLFVGVILPLVQIIVLTERKKKYTRFYAINIAILYVMSFCFFIIALYWALMIGIFKI